MTFVTLISDKFKQVYGGIDNPTNKLAMSEGIDGEFQFNTPDG